MKKETHLKLACFAMSITMSIVTNLPPILFLTFRSMYGLSFSLLGLLILINFSVQLAVDLIFSFFSHKFNVSKTVKAMPWLAVAGFILYAAAPVMFPGYPFIGLCLGTIVFSAASGLAEVLISPIIAALPSDDPERTMSGLHSIFAWGVVGVVILATLFLQRFGSAHWQLLIAISALVPLLSSILFAGAEIPRIETPEKSTGALKLLGNRKLWLFFAAVFLAGALELVMSQWSSSYLEQALGVPKVWGDVCGVAMFGGMLAIGRTLYAKKGNNVESVLLLGAIGAAICYFVATVTPIPIFGLIACAMTGLCVSLMWPGSLSVAAARFPSGGVVVYAMMAASGDMGAAIAPQLVGIITDAALGNAFVLSLAEKLMMAPEKISIKLGMTVGLILSLIAISIFYRIKKSKEASD